jgi:hypothetical protein
MKKESIYLDTSVPNACLDIRCPERMAITKIFWNTMFDSFQVYISEYTLIELGRTEDQEHRKKLFDLVSTCTVLPLKQSISELAEVFLNSGIVPKNEKGDAIHLATAVVYGMDLLVSWNYQHMVNYHTKRHLPVISAGQGYFKQLIIASPNEFSRE